MSIKIPDNAIHIINLLKDNNYQAYLVGGCVRDMIMQKGPNDWDICTSARPETVASIFANTINTGLKHGTVTVVEDGEMYEVTTFRKDCGYSDGRRPDKVDFINDLKDDLSRRDFTINAIAYDVFNDEFIDPFNGRYDIDKGIIKCVGNPNERFKEDGLRILRAIRFAARYGFYIDEDTENAMINNKTNLKNISNERICAEFTKTLLTDYPEYLMNYPDILCEIIPEFIPTLNYDQHSIWHNRDLYDHMKYALSCAGNLFSQGENFDLITNLSIMFHDISKPDCKTEDEDGYYHFKGHGKVSAETAEQILKRLRFDNKTIENVKQLIFYHDSTIEDSKKSIKRWLNKLGEEQFNRLLQIKICDILAQDWKYFKERYDKIYRIKRLSKVILKEKSCFSLKDLAINGDDLISIGIPSGKNIGIILNDLLNLVIDGKIKNEKTSMINYVFEYYH